METISELDPLEYHPMEDMGVDIRFCTFYKIPLISSSGDGGVLKETLHDGYGDKPPKGSKIFGNCSHLIDLTTHPLL